VSSEASAKPSISPNKSITANPSRRRTSARKALACGSTLRSFGQMHDQINRMMDFVGADVHFVDHILDEKQSPTARRLLAGQLGRQIGRLALRDGVTPAVVRDAHPQIIELADHLN